MTLRHVGHITEAELMVITRSWRVTRAEMRADEEGNYWPYFFVETKKGRRREFRMPPKVNLRAVD